MQVLTNQEFTYRESPAEQDGYGKFKALYGNTLVWNQLCRTLTSGNWAIVGAGSGALTFADGVATFSTTNNYGRFLYTPNNLVSGHKYLLSVEIKAYTNASINYALGSQSSYGSQGCICSTGTVSDANWHRYTSVGTFTSGTDDKVLVQNNSGASNLHEIQVRNIMYFDLTQMGLNITDPSDFTSLFPLSYYAYNQGSLLSFMGNGIKTVGKNLNPWTGVDYVASTSRTVFLKKGDYVLSTDNGNNFEGSTQIYFCLADSNGNNITSGGITSGYLSLNDSGTFYYGGYGRNNIPFTLNFDAFVSFGFNNQRPTNINEIQLEFGSTPSDYEPYTSSALSLPISTYFPTGMKSAGTAYDELTPKKAITRIGAVDLGSVTWAYNSTDARFYANINGVKPSPTSGTAFSSGMLTVPYQTIFTDTPVSFGNMLAYIADKDMLIWQYTAGTGIANVNIKDTRYTDAATFKTAISGVYLYYELATPIETSFTTASLVTENAEIPYPFFKSYKGGIEQILPENGSVPTTAPIICDLMYSSGAIQVTTYPNPEQGGETSGDGWYLVGEEATVNALPNEHYAFNNWVLDGEIVSTDPEYTFEVKDE